MEPNNNVIAKEISEKDYIFRWSQNAKQHFDDGDYQWLCEYIRKHITIDKGIVEVGCGAGYSTLSYAENDFNVVALDINTQALEVTYDLLEEYINKGRVVLAQSDIVHYADEIVTFLANNTFPANVVVLCNPGGNVNAAITTTEYALLRRFGFSEDEINDNQVNLLHKWALIYATCLFSRTTDRMLVVVERGNKEDLEEELTQIGNETGIRKIAADFRVIKPEPEGGIPLGKTDSELYWGAALYYPR